MESRVHVAPAAFVYDCYRIPVLGWDFPGGDGTEACRTVVRGDLQNRGAPLSGWRKIAPLWRVPVSRMPVRCPHGPRLLAPGLTARLSFVPCEPQNRACDECARRRVHCTLRHRRQGASVCLVRQNQAAAISWVGRRIGECLSFTVVEVAGACDALEIAGMKARAVWIK